MRGEFSGGVWVGRGSEKWRGWEFVEVDVGDREWVPALDARLGLAAVGGGADVVDRDVVGGDETGEVEELVEMALCWKWYHNNHHLGFFSVVGLVLIEIGCHWKGNPIRFGTLGVPMNVSKGA